jgi:hypothetical protein
MKEAIKKKLPTIKKAGRTWWKKVSPRSSKFFDKPGPGVIAALCEES